MRSVTFIECERDIRPKYGDTYSELCSAFKPSKVHIHRVNTTHTQHTHTHTHSSEHEHTHTHTHTHTQQWTWTHTHHTHTHTHTQHTPHTPHTQHTHTHTHTHTEHGQPFMLWRPGAVGVWCTESCYWRWRECCTFHSPPPHPPTIPDGPRLELTHLSITSPTF